MNCAYQGICPTCQQNNVLYVDIPGPTAIRTWNCTTDGTSFNLAYRPNGPVDPQPVVIWKEKKDPPATHNGRRA